MISYIKGTLAEKMEGAAVVEAGSIGYRIFMPASALELLGAVGDEVVVYTYFQVREDAMSLYGFLSRQDREMFKQLIGVNGIGPKAALGLLGTICGLPFSPGTPRQFPGHLASVRRRRRGLSWI